MRYFKYILFFILVIVVTTVFISCEKQTIWNLQSSPPVVIVDAILTSELKKQEIRIYYSSSQLNMIPNVISGAKIKVSTSDRLYSFAESESLSGVYFSDSVFRCATNTVYQLTIQAEGISDTAIATMVAASPIQTYNIIPDNNFFRFIYHDDNTPSFTEIIYDWSADLDFTDSLGYSKAAETFYTLNNLDVNKFFAPSKQLINFPENTRLIRKKYSLQRQHQEFVRSMLLETEWRGGIFDVEQGNVITNFSNGMRGWFGVCMVLSDTIDF